MEERKKTEKEQFLEFCAGAIEKKVSIMVFVTIPGNKNHEKIINDVEDIENKMKYYDATYDDDLNHKHAPGISIAGVNYGSENNNKTLDVVNTADAKKKVNDVKVVGNPDAFKLIAKASSESQGWMKSTKAMEIPGLGVVLQVTTQQDKNVAEALTFIKGATLSTFTDENGNTKTSIIKDEI